MKKIFEKLKTIDKGTFIRTLLLILAAINQVIAIIGMTSFADAAWYQIASVCCTIAISLVTAWKNNNFTHAAQLSQEVLDALKDKKLDEEEIKKLLDKANENKEDTIN